MADIIAADLHKKVDALMDRFYGAGVASHPTIIEQINYLLFMRALSFKDDEYRQLGIKDSDKIIFDGELEKYRWENLLSLNAEALFIALEDCLRKIPESTTNKTVRLVFRNAHLKLYDKPSLRLVVHEIDAFAKSMDESEHAGKHDIFGDTYEYLLSKLAQAGTSGQFRTPRHIIDFLVAVVAPKKGEIILDPAVGTAGFLVKAFEYMRSIYTSPEVAATGGSFDKLTPKELSVLYEHTFSGFDSDEDMIKFGMMNLYLHGLENAQLIRQNTLTDTAGNRDKYDVILANPPFSGKIDRDSVAQELQMNTGATEVLFLRYIIEHLKEDGRAGIIVPEGVIFNTSAAHTKIRQLLIDNGLWCVVSLPAGVFNPYSGVKTSIIFLDKEISTKEQFDRIMFLKISTDGYSLGAQRHPTGHSDLNNALILLKECIKEIKTGTTRPSSQYYFPFQDPSNIISVAPLNYNFELVKRGKIAESKTYSLNQNEYSQYNNSDNQKYPLVSLGDEKYFHIESGGTPSSKEKIYWDGDIDWATLVDLPANNRITYLLNTKRKISSKGLANSSAKLLPIDSILISSRATIGRIAINKIPVATNQGFKNIIVKDKTLVDPEYLANVLSQLKDELTKLATGGTFIEFSKSSLTKIKIPLPPIEIQLKIISELNGYQDIIDQNKETIILFEQKIKSKINEIYGE
jgi:type I restriction enzyme M protein